MVADEIAEQTKVGVVSARIVRTLVRMVLPLFGRMEIHGREHLCDGGKLFVSNHIGWADPIWIAYACYPTVLHQMAKKELFSGALSAGILTGLGAFPVDRERPSPGVIKYAAGLLRRGSWLLIFPTGTRDQSQTEARRGAALIALMASAPIIPVHYEGPTNIGFVHLIKRPKISVRFGPKIEARRSSHDRRMSADLTGALDIAILDLAALSKPID